MAREFSTRISGGGPRPAVAALLARSKDRTPAPRGARGGAASPPGARMMQLSSSSSPRSRLRSRCFALFSRPRCSRSGPVRRVERGVLGAGRRRRSAAGLAFAFFAGWAAQEPDPLRRVGRARGLFGSSARSPRSRWSRALLRALAALRVEAERPGGDAGDPLAARRGVGDVPRGGLGEEALDAALAHEEAHRRRAIRSGSGWSRWRPISVAAPGRAGALRAWLSRAGDGARRRGARARRGAPVALAEAIAVAARASTPSGRAVARRGAPTNGLARRVRRLLRGEARSRGGRPAAWRALDRGRRLARLLARPRLRGPAARHPPRRRAVSGGRDRLGRSASAISRSRWRSSAVKAPKRPRPDAASEVVLSDAERATRSICRSRRRSRARCRSLAALRRGLRAAGRGGARGRAGRGPARGAARERWAIASTPAR